MAAIEWFRLWHDMPNDPKWRTVARTSGQPISLVLSVALHLMVDASRNVTRGHVDVTAEDVASALDVTDEAVEAVLEARRRAGEIIEYHYEALTLKLADNTRYTPDFLVMTALGELELHEVKGGFIREDGWQKLKIAAGMFPFRFFLCQKLAKKDGGKWSIREV